LTCANAGTVTGQNEAFCLVGPGYRFPVLSLLEAGTSVYVFRRPPVGGGGTQLLKKRAAVAAGCSIC
jgi:hypothetical protein